MLMPNKVSGYFDKTTSKYLNSIFNENFIDIYLKTTVLLKLIEETLKEKYSSQIRLKYHILYIIYRIIIKEEDTRKQIATFFREPDDREQLLKGQSLDEIIIKINSSLDIILSSEDNYNKLIGYIIQNFKQNYPDFFNIIDKGTEKILYTSVEKLKYVNKISLPDFDSTFTKTIDEIIK